MQLNRIIETTAGGQIPDQVDSKAIEYLAKKALTAWETPIYEYLDACQQLLLQVIETAFTKKFERYQRTPLFTETYQILESFLIRWFEQHTDAVVNRIYRLEKEQIATLNDKAYKAVKAKHLDRLIDTRARNREEQREVRRRAIALNPNFTARKRAAEEKKIAQEEKESALPGNDRFANEIELLAGVRAYYELASRRFVDNLFISTLGEWMRGVKGDLELELWNKLGFGGGEAEEAGSEFFQACATLRW